MTTDNYDGGIHHDRFFDGAPETVEDIAREMLDFEAPAFEGDLHVDAADLVEAFAAWRGRLKAALG